MEPVPEPSQSSEATAPKGTNSSHNNKAKQQNNNGHSRPLVVTQSTGGSSSNTTVFVDNTTMNPSNIMAGVPIHRRPHRVVAVEEDDDDHGNNNNNNNNVVVVHDDDVIPGPPRPPEQQILQPPKLVKKTSAFSKIFPKSSMMTLGNSQASGSSSAINNMNTSGNGNSKGSSSKGLVVSQRSNNNPQHDSDGDLLDVSDTEHNIRGKGILASRTDLGLPPVEFAAGCILLQACAVGELKRVQELLQDRPTHVNFRDYDRRTALHVAASEGHLEICKYLVHVKRAKINRSDRWGGSPLDDAHRHRHRDVVHFLRENGAVTGSGNQSTNLITAAAAGDVDEVHMLLTAGGAAMEAKIVSQGDYDKRTPLHLAASGKLE